VAVLAVNGGPKSCCMQWPTWPVWDDAERQGLLGVLESGAWWYGERVREFERRFADYQGARFGVTVSNGTAALEASLMALGIEPGDEVIVPPYTFVATASAVLRLGAEPVFADIQPDTLCIDPDDVERRITPRTRAVIPVHLGGRVADMDRILAIARSHGLKVVEDACHSWGSQWKGKGTGSIGTCGVFSFQASKNITSAEGGIILTDEPDVADTCRSVTNCGRRKGDAWYEHSIVAGNMRLTEFQAALLLAQLTRLPEQSLRREANAALLDQGLHEVPGIITIPPDPRMTRRGCHLYCFRLDTEKLGVSRASFIEAMTAEGVPLTPGYERPLYRNAVFNGRPGARAHCPVCEQVCNDTCWIFHTLLLADASAMRSIVDAVAKVCTNIGKEGVHGRHESLRTTG
jgi:dTDP-4-amino-4,6-dideoxygalactose transaminase